MVTMLCNDWRSIALTRGLTGCARGSSRSRSVSSSATPRVSAASISSRVGTPFRCTTKPPKSGPSAWPSGGPAATTAIIEPSRSRGVTSACTANITPVLPNIRPTNNRDAANSHRLELRAARAEHQRARIG